MMNPTVKNVLYLVGGLLVGGGAGVFGSRRYFQQKYSNIAEKQIREMEEYYRLEDAYRRPIVDIFDGGEEVNPTENGREKGILPPEEREKMRDLRNQQKKERVDYGAMYHGKDVEPDPAEMESPEEEEEYYEDVVNPMKEEIKPPEVIDEEELGYLPAHIDHQTLQYYTYDDVLAEERTELENQEIYVGDCLEDSGFLDDPDLITIFVLNHELQTVYEIEKFEASFEAMEEEW